MRSWILIALALVAGSPGCGPPEGLVTIDVTLSDLTPEAQSLKVTPTLTLGRRSFPQQPAQANRRLQIRIGRASLADDEVISLRVQGLGSTGCQVSVGSAQVPLMPGVDRYAASLALAPEPGCRLRVRLPEQVQSGQGTVSAAPASDRRGGGEALYDRIYDTPPGVVELSASPDAESFLAGWGGGGPDCRGSGRCRVTLNEGITDITALLLPRRRCHADGLCWENPLPQGNALRSVSVLPGGDAWAVGSNGTIQRRDARTGAWLPLPPSDGGSGTLFGVWARSADEVWIVGERGTVRRWDGAGLRTLSSGATGALLAVTGDRASGEVWIGGQGGRVLRWDGAALQPVEVEYPADILSIFRAPDGAVWAGGDSERIWRRGVGDEYFARVRISADGDPITGLWASGPDDIWAVGGQHAPDGMGGALVFSTVLRWDGNLWRRDRTWDALVQQRNDLSRLFTVWGSGPTDVWTTGDNGLLFHHDGKAWSAVASGTSAGLRAIDGTSRDEVIAVGTAGIVLQRSQGAFGSGDVVPRTTLERVRDCQGLGAWAAGPRGQLLRRWPDGTWHAVDVPGGETHDVWCSPRGDVWTAGDDGILIICDQCQRYELGRERFVRYESPTRKDLFGLWGSAYNDIWAVGAEGTILHFDGSRWMPSPVDPNDRASGRLLRVWGSGANDVWAVGDRSAIEHWDGSRWTLAVVPLPDPPDLFSVSGSGRDDVWAVGNQGLVAHFRGRLDQAVLHRLRYTLSGKPALVLAVSDVWLPARGLVVLAADSAVLRMDNRAGAFDAAPSAAFDLGPAELTGTALAGIDGSDRRMFAVGEGAAILGGDPTRGWP